MEFGGVPGRGVTALAALSILGRTAHSRYARAEFGLMSTERIGLDA